MAKLVQINNLIKQFPVKASGFTFSNLNINAVNNISFAINHNETFGMVGESGCGKTTSARLLFRIYEPTLGEFFFDKSDDEINNLKKLKNDLKELKQANPSSKEIKDLEKQLKLYKSKVDVFSYSKKDLHKLRPQMQYVFQDPSSSLNPRMTVLDIIGEALVVNKFCTKRELPKRVKELLSLVDLSSDSMNKYPHEFSGGQKQRISIARALALKPKFIVCDEAVSALDVSIQSQILNLLLDLQKEFNLSYLFIAHNLTVVQYMCDRIAVMYLGKIVEQTTSEQLYAKPLHPYTKLLFEVIPEPEVSDKFDEIPPMGEVPSPIFLPKGCYFNTRCPIRKDICFKEEPPLEEKEDGHYCACHFVPKKDTKK